MKDAIIHWINAWLMEIYNSPRIMLSIAALLTLWLIVRILKRRYAAIKIFQTDSGNIEITRRALHNIVYNACAQVHMTHTPKICARILKGKLHLEIAIKLGSDQRLLEIATLLQDSIVQTLSRNLGMENLGRINVKMVDFIPVRERKMDAKCECGCDPTDCV